MSSDSSISPHLQVQNVSKSFGGLKAVQNVSFSVHPGEIVGLIGPNGAGKTTLFNLISGALSLDQGSIIFNGSPLDRFKAYDMCKAGIGRTFQIVKPLVNLTVFENVVVGALLRNKRHQAFSKAQKVVEYVGLGSLAKTPAGSLTLESRKRLELARALATEPKLLLLDEILAGLTPTEVEDSLNLIRDIASQGISIIMIEHILQAVMSLSNRIIVLDHGQEIAEGKPSDVVRDPMVIKAYLGGEYNGYTG